MRSLAWCLSTSLWSLRCAAALMGLMGAFAARGALSAFFFECLPGLLMSAPAFRDDSCAVELLEGPFEKERAEVAQGAPILSRELLDCHVQFRPDAHSHGYFPYAHWRLLSPD